MTGNIPSRGLIFSGVLLILILGCAVLTDGTSIDMSRNALSKSKEAQSIFEISGELAWAGDDTFYNFHQTTLRRLDGKGEMLWEKPQGEKHLVYMGNAGVLLSEEDTLVMLDSLGIESFIIRGFLEDPELLETTGGYHLVVGKRQGKEVASLIGQGTIMWYLDLEDSQIISGTVTSDGYYCAAALIDEEAWGQLLLINSQGKVLWQWREPTMLLLTKALEEGVVTVAEDRAFMVNYDGNVLWEYPFEATVCRADINALGYTSVALKQGSGSLYSLSRWKLLSLTPEGQLQWSYSLDREPSFVKMDEEHVFIIDDSQMLILTRQGLLTSQVSGQGFERISLADHEKVIGHQGEKSKLIRISGGR